MHEQFNGTPTTARLDDQLVDRGTIAEHVARTFPQLEPDSSLSRFARFLMHEPLDHNTNKAARVRNTFDTHYKGIEKYLMLGDSLKAAVAKSSTTMLDKLNPQDSWSYGWDEIRACRQVVKESHRLYAMEGALHFRELRETYDTPTTPPSLSERFWEATRKIVGRVASRG